MMKNAKIERSNPKILFRERRAGETPQGDGMKYTHEQQAEI